MRSASFFTQRPCDNSVVQSLILSQPTILVFLGISDFTNSLKKRLRRLKLLHFFFYHCLYVRIRQKF